MVWMCEAGSSGNNMMQEVVKVAMHSNAVILPCYASASGAGGGDGTKVLGKANLSGLPCLPVLSGPERSSLSVMYGHPVLVPHTSKPHASLLARHEEELLDEFKAMETKFTPLI